MIVVDALLLEKDDDAVVPTVGGDIVVIVLVGKKVLEVVEVVEPIPELLPDPKPELVVTLGCAPIDEIEGERPPMPAPI